MSEKSYGPRSRGRLLRAVGLGDVEDTCPSWVYYKRGRCPTAGQVRTIADSLRVERVPSGPLIHGHPVSFECVEPRFPRHDASSDVRHQQAMLRRGATAVSIRRLSTDAQLVRDLFPAPELASRGLDHPTHTNPRGTAATCHAYALRSRFRVRRSCSGSSRPSSLQKAARAARCAARAAVAIGLSDAPSA